MLEQVVCYLMLNSTSTPSVVMSVTLSRIQLWFVFIFKVSVRGKFAILHNFTFLSGWINLKVIFKIKETPRKNLISAGGYCARKIVLHINYLIES